MKIKFDGPKDQSPNNQGLTAEDHGYLNHIASVKTIEECREIFAVMRKKYANDPIALQWIDGYDGESIYSSKMKELIQAHKSDNLALVAELENWFKTNYPAVGQST